MLMKWEGNPKTSVTVRQVKELDVNLNELHPGKGEEIVELIRGPLAGRKTIVSQSDMSVHLTESLYGETQRSFYHHRYERIGRGDTFYYAESNYQFNQSKNYSNFNEEDVKAADTDLTLIENLIHEQH